MGMKIKAKTFCQFVKFILVGLCNTIVSYLIYTLAYYICNFNYHISNALGFIVSIFVAYILQNKFVFKELNDQHQRIWWKVLVKTYVTYLFSGLIVTELLLVLWLNIIHIEKYLDPLISLLKSYNIYVNNRSLAVSLAPFLNMIFTIPINFFLNKYWAYRSKSG